MAIIDPIKLAQDLIRCPSVTPEEAGSLDILEDVLKPMGFVCHRLKYAEVDNLYARLGAGAPHFCFAGHVDVVPVGDQEAWSFDPFGGEVKGDKLCGRGASDMKGAVASFVSALSHFLAENSNFKGSVSLLITCDEEGPGINGTAKVLEHLSNIGEIPDFCLVGEPTNPHYLGEMMKVGRRGSMSAHLTVTGVQGHVAYPHLADNPVPKMVKLLQALSDLELDQGSDYFQPSNLEIVTMDTGNVASNVIPSKTTARLNIRFNDHHTGRGLCDLIDRVIADQGMQDCTQVEYHISGESFITPTHDLTEWVQSATTEVTGHIPEPSTTGGTSDARFIAQYCPVVEFGGVGETMHQIDEAVSTQDVHKLTKIYHCILRRAMAG